MPADRFRNHSYDATLYALSGVARAHQTLTGRVMTRPHDDQVRGLNTGNCAATADTSQEYFLDLIARIDKETSGTSEQE